MACSSNSAVSVRRGPGPWKVKQLDIRWAKHSSPTTHLSFLLSDTELLSTKTKSELVFNAYHA